jgi:CBS domain-containing protein
MMEQGGIGAIIVKENENPVGIVTDRDFATKIAANNLPFETTVEKIMSSPLITISHDNPISAAAEMMSSKKIRKLAVTENNKIIGIITSTDLVNQLAK